MLNKIYCFYFHSVYDSPLNYGVYKSNVISTQLFEQKLKYLEKLGDFISLNDLFNKDNNLPQNSVLITFDDGFKDNLRIFNLLEKYQIPFNVFITYGFINQDVYPFEYLLTDYNSNEFFKLKKKLKFKDYNKRYKILKNKIGSDIFDYKQSNLFMNWTDVQSLVNSSNCVIGSHGLTHVPLSCLSNQQKYNEIYQSKIKIEEKANCQIDFFSFPYGDFDSKSKKLTQKYYHYSFSTQDKPIYNLNYSILPRIDGKNNNL